VHAGGGVLGAVCIIDINASTVDVPAVDQLALHQTTGDAQCSAVHSWAAQLQVTNSACLGDDVIIPEPVLKLGIRVLLQKRF